MKLTCKMIFILGACFLGAAFMFFLGVFSERRLAAKRLVIADPLNLEAIVAAAKRDAAEQIIDIDALDFPEELRRNDKLGRDHNIENEDEEVPKGILQPQRRHEAADTTADRETKYFLQIGAFKSKKNAKNLISSLSEKGFNPILSTATGSTQPPQYRVRLGPFDNLDDISSTTQKLKENNLSYIVLEVRNVKS